MIGAFIPAVMGVSTAFVFLLSKKLDRANLVARVSTGGEAYVKVAKVIILMTDCFLNFYFISEVKDNLVRNGLKKYEKLANFNMGIIVVSVLMDVRSHFLLAIL